VSSVIDRYRHDRPFGFIFRSLFLVPAHTKLPKYFENKLNKNEI